MQFILRHIQAWSQSNGHENEEKVKIQRYNVVIEY